MLAFLNACLLLILAREGAALVIGEFLSVNFSTALLLDDSVLLNTIHQVAINLLASHLLMMAILLNRLRLAHFQLGLVHVLQCSKRASTWLLLVGKLLHA